MTFTYTPAAGAAPLHQVRLKVGDTDSTNPVFTDEEIDMVLGVVSQDPDWAAAELLLAAAANTARSAIMWKVLGSDIEVDKRTIPAELRRLAEVFARRVDENAVGSLQAWFDGNAQDLRFGIMRTKLHDFDQTPLSETIS